MVDFSFQSPTEIVFGRHAEERVGTVARAHGATRVLLHFGGGSIKASGLYDRVKASLQKAGLHVVELGGVQPNPRWALVEEGVRLCREEKLDFLLGVGGGSVIDSCKAIGAQAVTEEDVWEKNYMKRIPVVNSLPIGTILTIPAAGSEMSNSSVITHEARAIKTHAFGPGMLPRFSILNPELTYTLPPYQVACGASDILAHMMERYFTQDSHVDLSDRLLEGAMKSLLYLAPRALENPEDYGVRAELMWLGTVAHNDFIGLGRTSDWATHGMEHELSALYDIAHGAGLAIMFPAWMKRVYPQGRSRFVQFATRVMGVGGELSDTDAVILEGIKALEAFYRRIGMPVSFQDVNLPEKDIEEMARKAVSYGQLGNFVVLDQRAVASIYRLAL